MRIALRVVIVLAGAFIGASLLTLLFLPFCLGATRSGYCAPLSDALLPLARYLVPDGGAPGAFLDVWLGYFTTLLVAAGLLWIGLRLSKQKSIH
jgi:hypothetical protein